MPIYEYQCTSCHHHFDLMQKISDPPETLCPECSKHTVIKLVSAAGFQLKGTGWYATDFKNKGTETKDSSTKENAVKPDQTPSSSTEPAAAPVVKPSKGDE